MHFGLDRGGTSASTANRKLWPAAAGSPKSALLTQSAPKDSVAHAAAAMALAATPTQDVALYVFRRPPSLAKSDGSARLHAERLTMRNASGTVFHDALGEKALEARLVAVMEAVTTLNDRAHPALSAYTAGQSCRCASSAASGGEDAIARADERARASARMPRRDGNMCHKSTVLSFRRETAVAGRFAVV
jgi:hypothetical protein